MALLVDALNKADRDRRNIGLSLEALPEKPAALDTPTKAAPAAKDTAPLLPPTPPIPPLVSRADFMPIPPIGGNSFRGAWVLLALIVVAVSAAGLYWWIAPTSGLTLTEAASRAVRPNKVSPNPTTTATNTINAQSIVKNVSEALSASAFPAEPAQAKPTAAPAPAPSNNAEAFSQSKITVHQAAKSVDADLPPSQLRGTITTSFNGGTPLAEALNHLQNRRYAEAEALYGKVLRLDPNNIEALQNRGVIAYNLGRYDEAQSWMQKILTVNPNHGFAKQVLQALSTDGLGSSSAIESISSKDDGVSSASKHFIHGNRLAEQGLWVEAQNQFFLAWQAQSENADYAYNLAVALDHLGDGKSAAQFYQRAISNAQLPKAAPYQFPIPIAEKRLQALTFE